MKNYNKNTPESIQAMFGSIAKDYDRNNALLSFQLHRYWNKRLVAETIETPNTHVADLCCGTGEIAFTWLKKASEKQTAYLIDFCPEMLECAKQKAIQQQLNSKHDLTYLQADVQAIPLADKSIGAMTMAYGIRNVKNPSLCFKETFRVLNKGGKLGILELTEPTNVILRLGHRFYLRAIMPIIGKIATSNPQAYEYLSQSIQAFVRPQGLAALLQDTGFRDVKIIPLTGGIATIITATK